MTVLGGTPGAHGSAGEQLASLFRTVRGGGDPPPVAGQAAEAAVASVDEALPLVDGEAGYVQDLADRAAAAGVADDATRVAEAVPQAAAAEVDAVSDAIADAQRARAAAAPAEVAAPVAAAADDVADVAHVADDAADAARVADDAAGAAHVADDAADIARVADDAAPAAADDAASGLRRLLGRDPDRTRAGLDQLRSAFQDIAAPAADEAAAATSAAPAAGAADNAAATVADVAAAADAPAAAAADDGLRFGDRLLARAGVELNPRGAGGGLGRLVSPGAAEAAGKGAGELADAAGAVGQASDDVSRIGDDLIRGLKALATRAPRV